MLYPIDLCYLSLWEIPNAQVIVTVVTATKGKDWGGGSFLIIRLKTNFVLCAHIISS